MSIPIAIIGAAHQHVDYVLDEAARRQDVTIVAVADHDPARRQTLSDRTGAPGYPDLATVLDRHTIRAAAVVTEFARRAPIVAELARHGILAITDKPMAVDAGQLATIETALAGRDLVALLLEKRFYPVTLALHAVLEQGELGDIVTISGTSPHKLRPAQRPGWMFDPAQYGTILADLVVHDADLALWLLGIDGGTVSGWVSPTPAMGTHAFAAAGRAVLTCDAGPQVVIDVDWMQPDASARHGDYAMRVSGTRGRADVLFAENRLLVETATRPVHEVPLPPGAPPARFAFDHLVTGQPLAIPVRDALRATRIAVRAQESAVQAIAGQGGPPLRW